VRLRSHVRKTPDKSSSDLSGHDLASASLRNRLSGRVPRQRYSASIGLARFVEAVSCKSCLWRANFSKAATCRTCVESGMRRSRMPKGRLWTAACSLKRALERSLWRAAERNRCIFGCAAEGRKLVEASSGGCCRDDRSLKQIEKRPPAERLGSLRRSGEIPTRRAEAR
jgi:hypothetical protein